MGTKPVLIKYKGAGTQDFIEGEVDENVIKPDVKRSETHGYQSNVTQMALEDGSIVAEHIIQQPITVSVQFEETNGLLISGTVQKNGTFDKLVDIWKNKTVCQVITEHKIYDNMVVQNMPIQHRAPYKGALSITCDFTQLSFTSPTRAVFIGKSEGLTKSSSGTVQGGQQKMKTTQEE